MQKLRIRRNAKTTGLLALCVLGKAIEKVVHEKVSAFLLQNHLFSKYQSGFRKGHSTMTALLKVVDDLRNSMDKRLMNLLVLLDLSKAFDCVHHELLLTKLKFLGFSDCAIEWFKSYLTGRSHRVYVSDVRFSNWASIVTGVPQGSVLGPLLFIIYLFDLPTVIKHCLYHMYADDLQLYISFSLNDFIEICALMCDDIVSVIDFCNKHNLELNISKTQAIKIGTQRYLTKLTDCYQSFQFVVEDCVVPFSNAVNNLGVIIDGTLSWNDHCTVIAQKVFGILAQLRRNFPFIPLKIRKMLISTLAFPHFDYASVLFTDMSAGNSVKLQKVQNACVRFITGARVFDHITPLYRELKILKIKERRLLAVADLVRKVIISKTPEYLYQQFQFTSVSNVRSTRSSRMMLQIPIHRMEKFHNSFLVQAAKIWNDFKLYEYMHLSDPAFRRLMFEKCLARL